MNGHERARTYKDLASQVRALQEQFRSEVMQYGLPGELRQLSAALGMHEAASATLEALATLVNAEMEVLQPPLGGGRK